MIRTKRISLINLNRLPISLTTTTIIIIILVIIDGWVDRRNILNERTKNVLLSIDYNGSYYFIVVIVVIIVGAYICKDDCQRVIVDQSLWAAYAIDRENDFKSILKSLPINNLYKMIQYYLRVINDLRDL